MEALRRKNSGRWHVNVRWASQHDHLCICRWTSSRRVRQHGQRWWYSHVRMCRRRPAGSGRAALRRRHGEAALRRLHQRESPWRDRASWRWPPPLSVAVQLIHGRRSSSGTLSVPTERVGIISSCTASAPPFLVPREICRTVRKKRMRRTVHTIEITIYWFDCEKFTIAKVLGAPPFRYLVCDHTNSTSRHRLRDLELLKRDRDCPSLLLESASIPSWSLVCERPVSPSRVRPGNCDMATSRLCLRDCEPLNRDRDRKRLCIQCLFFLESCP